MSTPDDWLEVGKIVAPQGLRGELRIYPDSDFPERFMEPGQRWLLPPGAKLGRDEPQPVRLLSGRYLNKQNLYVVRFAEVVDRTSAENLRGAKLLVSAHSRPPLEAGEYHLMDLMGMEVFDQVQQVSIGQVVGLATAAQDLLQVQLTDSEQVILIPFVDEIVPIVDLTTKRLEIVPPPGLLHL